MAMELIFLHTCILNDRTTETVNARDLHEFLEIGRDFATWLKARISQYDFRESEDFEVVESLSSPKRGSAKSRPQTVKDYYVSLDMAKELAMVERNEKANKPAAILLNANARFGSNLICQPPNPSINIKF